MTHLAECFHHARASLHELSVHVRVLVFLLRELLDGFTALFLQFFVVLL